MAWLSRVEFGVLALVFCVVLVRLMLREVRTFAAARAAEDWVLLAGSVLTAARVGMSPVMGAVETGWVLGFGLICTLYLAVKGFRATRVEN